MRTTSQQHLSKEGEERAERKQGRMLTLLITVQPGLPSGNRLSQQATPIAVSVGLREADPSCPPTS